MNNPYAAPDAVLSDVAGDDDTYDPKIFAIHGRIGRLRYLAYSWFLMFIIMFGIGILSAMLIPFMVNKNAPNMGSMILMGLIYLPILAVTLIMAKRRFNDLDSSGWLSLLILVPFLNFFVGLYLVFAPGTKGVNGHGPKPSKNPALMIIAAILLPIIIVGILAAVAIPAYQDYTLRAKAASIQQQR